MNLPDLGIAIKNGTAPALLRDGMRIILPIVKNEPVIAMDKADGTCEISLEVMGYMGTFVFPAKSATVVRHVKKNKQWSFTLTHEVEQTRVHFTAGMPDDFAPIKVRF